MSPIQMLFPVSRLMSDSFHNVSHVHDVNNNHRSLVNPQLKTDASAFHFRHCIGGNGLETMFPNNERGS